MPSSLHFKSDYLRGLLTFCSRGLRRAYRDLPQEPDPNQPRAETLLLAERWLIQGQIEDLDEALTASLCRKLARAGGTRDGDQPRIYRVIASTLGCLIETAFGAQSLGKLLTTDALRELFHADRLGERLTLAELWAIPSVVKLVLLERIARNLSELPLASPNSQWEVCGAIECLRALARIRWPELIESISVVHHVLGDDPSGTYPQMEFHSRDLYRHAVEDLAAESDESEETVARLAVTLAQEMSHTDDPRRSHIGYYLIGPGVAYLRRRGRLRPSRRTRLRELALRFPNLIYEGGIAALTVVLTLALFRALQPLPLWWTAVLWLPLSQIALWVVNWGVSRRIPPRAFPRLDFSKGIPASHRTAVAVPTLLLSRPMVERLLERLEVHYLANRDPNLIFALLTDFPDSAEPFAQDDPLLAYCMRGIRRLNQRYATEGCSPFYLFHRMQRWNEGQSVWMGHERKRGKLEDFNRLLLGVDDTFPVKVGDLSRLQSIRYVITVDTDTLLPRDTAWKLVGTLAHPLQRPVIDPVSKIVKEGYGILQPRVSIGVESALKSRLAQIYSGLTGLDTYTTAISDVYQDLFGQATFSGKGIYDVRALYDVLDGRFPQNTILSHDLIEGEHTRVALITDTEVIEDYPSRYEGYSKRRHRWVRGDWQLLAWLLPWAPQEDGRWHRNPLGALSRWKIADNLRRSLFEINLFLMILLSWVLEPNAAFRITIAALGILAFCSYADFVTSLFPLPRFGSNQVAQRLAELRRKHGEAFLSLAFLPHQALLMTDAIVRTLARRFITGRKLLEWESMAQAESPSGNAFSWWGAHCLSGLILGAMLTAWLKNESPLLPLALMALWLSAPLIARYVNAAPKRPAPERSREVEFLRDISLQTWRYFTDFSRPENHWLVPDNVQEEPEAIAHRASPTNIGLQLASNVAAYDFGYLTGPELARRLGDLLDTLLRMERYRGHLWNWYDTGTLEPMRPRYVSTVDSGNLAAALIAVKQACESMRKQALVDVGALVGMRDHCMRVRNTLPSSAPHLDAALAIESMIAKAESRPTNLFLWSDALHEVASLVDRLDRHVNTVCPDLEAGEPEIAGELRFWQRALHERAHSALNMLCDYAPWLAEPYRSELIARAYDSRFEELMESLTHVPQVGELSSVYDEIERSIGELLVSPDPLVGETRRLLVRLQGDIATAKVRAQALADCFSRHSRTIWQMVSEMDFSFLFNEDRDQMHIGYNAEKNCLDDYYYDLLASEARTAVFLAVAKGDAPRRTWFRLGRKVTSFQGHTTLVSWSGTMFEYLMPSIFMKTLEPTLLGQSLAGVVQVQQAYAKKLNIPWGMSESSCSSRNLEQSYDYRAFGVPAVSLSQAEKGSVVVAPYASMLALMIDRRPATENLVRMASEGWTGRYGFFDAIDFQSAVSTAQRTATVVRSFMAHHQGMGLLALCNTLLDNPMQNRFHAEPIVAATELLLHERMPARLAVAGD